MEGLTSAQCGHLEVRRGQCKHESHFRHRFLNHICYKGTRVYRRDDFSDKYYLYNTLFAIFD